jgi:predicted PurR-regulated permease PerM
MTNVFGIIYITGVVVALILLLVLAYYYDFVEKSDISDFSATTVLCVFSWLSVIILISIFKDKLIKGFKTIIKRYDDTKI